MVSRNNPKHSSRAINLRYIRLQTQMRLQLPHLLQIALAGNLSMKTYARLTVLQLRKATHQE